MSENELNDTARLLQRQWGLPEQAFPDWERLRQALRLRLAELLEDDFSNLVNIMYRLDINEKHFKEALGAGNASDISARLAEIVLQRELKRLETRRKYGQSGQEST